MICHLSIGTGFCPAEIQSHYIQDGCGCWPPRAWPEKELKHGDYGVVGKIVECFGGQYVECFGLKKRGTASERQLAGFVKA